MTRSHLASVAARAACLGSQVCFPVVSLSALAMCPLSLLILVALSCRDPSFSWNTTVFKFSSLSSKVFFRSVW